MFNFTFQGRYFEQTPIPVKNNKANRTTLSIAFAITGSPIPDLHYRAAVADTITANPDGSFSVGDDLLMSFSDTQTSLKPFLRKSEGKIELLVPISVGVFRHSHQLAIAAYAPFTFAHSHIRTFTLTLE